MGPTRPGGAESRRAEQCERAGGQQPQVPHAPFLPECSSFSPPTTVILLILLCFEGLLFLIFTSVMFGTQVHSICTDETVSGRPAHQVQPWARGLGGAGGGRGGCGRLAGQTREPNAQGPGVQGVHICAHTHTHTDPSLGPARQVAPGMGPSSLGKGARCQKTFRPPLMVLSYTLRCVRHSAGPGDILPTRRP